MMTLMRQFRFNSKAGGQSDPPRVSGGKGVAMPASDFGFSEFQLFGFFSPLLQQVPPKHPENRIPFAPIPLLWSRSVKPSQGSFRGCQFQVSGLKFHPFLPFASFATFAVKTRPPGVTPGNAQSRLVTQITRSIIPKHSEN